MKDRFIFIFLWLFIISSIGYLYELVTFNGKIHNKFTLLFTTGYLSHILFRSFKDNSANDKSLAAWAFFYEGFIIFSLSNDYCSNSSTFFQDRHFSKYFTFI